MSLFSVFPIKILHFFHFIFFLSTFFHYGETFDVFAKVDTPNYNFKLENLNSFRPGMALENLNKEFGPGELLRRQGTSSIYKYHVSHLRYKIKVLVQIAQEKVVDIFVILPTYFLHDVFHQSLINAYGRQNEFHQVEGNAIYIWKDKENVQHIYSATCTVTCFPLFYTGMPIEKKDKNQEEGPKSILDEISSSGYYKF